MILLRRLHIVNWMYYSVQTIELEQSNLLSGPTGSGKSSIVDALQVILLGEINSRHFNRSATGGKSDRSVVTYLRGRFSDSEWKRMDKAFSSYIVADFIDEQNKEVFCYGVVFDLAEDNQHDKDYFYIGKEFNLEWAVKSHGGGKVALSRKDFKNEVKTLGVPMKLFAPAEYKSDLLIRLGIYDDHYFDVFRSAVAYVPLEKIEDFIVRNICHMEDNIDVPGMRTAIHEYQRMQSDMADFLSRQKKLSEIKSIYDEYSSRLETLESQEYIIARAKVDALREEQLAAETQMGVLEDERADFGRQEEELETLKSEKTLRQAELIKLIDDDPEKRRKEELKGRLDACNESISKREKQRDNYVLLLGQRLTAWTRQLNALLEAAEELGLDRTEIKGAMRTLELYQQYSKETFGDLDVLALGEANTRLERLRGSVLGVQLNLKTLRDDARRRVEGYSIQLKALEEGVKSYPKDLLALKAHLYDALVEKYGEDATLDILADLITITDSAWVNVIEGYLRRQKMYLLTKPEHYSEALKVFRIYSREKKCYSYRLINTGSILCENMSVLDNSLAAVIESEHSAAARYIEYLLGRVERVDSIDIVGGRRTAITADGMLYSGFTAARMNEDDWRMKYIGQASIALQIEEIQRLYEEEE